ncbi:hypothetical protein MTR67_037895 [Solanum verrucosum]|uniref:Uncharacterized protein n=1 Tax=Solanum verrucosum TaxID=315347 RepID=A0AAF0ZP34_SOLVR|nr:hypothetical protein MTR67_037895 [Solanum verrucosum]
MGACGGGRSRRGNCRFYKRLFEVADWGPKLGGLGFSHIGREESEWLERAIQEEELKRAVEGCASNKALAPDVSTDFFKHCWNMVRSDLMDTVVDFQESGEFEKSLNASFVVITPKREEHCA